MAKKSMAVEKGWNVTKRRILIIISLFLIISVFGCNAIKGAGQDAEKAGKDIQKAADKNK